MKIMTDLLPRLFIKNYLETDNPIVRAAYGTLASIVGIFINVLLFVIKFVVGTISGSISIRADAINNLSDAASSVITLISFIISNKPADREHPFGHARIEYVSSLVVSFLIIHIGLDMLTESIDKILHPQETIISTASFVVLIVSILFKLWMYVFNRRTGKEINSIAMQATAADSISDVIGTSAVLLSVIITLITHFNTDGFMGLIVAVIILINGFKLAMESKDCLLGQSPDPEVVDEIIKYAKNTDGILGLHDILMHNYGPDQYFASMHAEVDGSRDVFETHDIIDNLEHDISKKFGIRCTIHLDPIVTGDPAVDAMREDTAQTLSEIDPMLGMHDFRMVAGPTHTNLIFDCTVPFECKLTYDEIKSRIDKEIKAKHPECFAVVNFDRI